MRLRDRSRERGAVMVMVALWLPVMAIFASFAIDAGHFWDFSRNLQNRVDAGVLAAGNQFGGSCFGTPTTAELNSIGQAAQQYTGAPSGTPSPGGTPNGTNLPYLYSSAAPYQNLPSNPLADPKNFFLVLNGASSADKGGTSFSAGNVCGATYDGQTSPTVDAWLTQEHVPFFFNFFGGLVGATISAHARVQLQGAGSTDSLPVAVPDPAQTPCLRAELINDQTGALVQDTNGNNIDVAMTPPNLGATPPKPSWTVTLPTFNVPAAQLSVEAYIPDDCNSPGYPGNGVLYDSKLDPVSGSQVADHGLEFINTFTPLPSGDPANPQIGSVNLSPVKDCDDPAGTEGPLQDPYFYFFPNATACSVTVNADVKFPSGMNGTAVNVSMDGGPAQKMTAPKGASNTYTNTFSIPSPDGANVGLPYRHTFTFSWKSNSGSGPFNGGNPLQATYAATSDGSDPADDSGPITQAFIGDTTGKIDVNSIQQGSNANLTVSFLLQGLALSQPGDPPIVLRASVQSRKATGAFNCWSTNQSGSAQALHDAIVNGCPQPVAVYSAAQGCVFLPATPLTCGALVPGNSRNQVTQAFQQRITSAVDNGQASPCDAWQAYSQSNTAISGFESWNASVPDPRIMVMAVTAPADIAGHGGPNNSLRILGFATFYVTGFDGDQWLPTGTGKGKKKGTPIPNCSSPTDQDEAFPGDPANQKDQIWGHFIKYAAAGTSNGQPCNLNDASVCVPALTR